VFYFLCDSDPYVTTFICDCILFLMFRLRSHPIMILDNVDNNFLYLIDNNIFIDNNFFFYFTFLLPSDIIWR
jgi:hypothetical protein